MQAIVLAGGLGTRLRSVVADRPKVLAEVAGRPFLEHLLGRLSAQGVHRVVLAVGYMREAIQAHFGERFGTMALGWSIEEEPLGTGGAVRRALSQVEAGPCFVLNGDTWLDADLNAMHRSHAQHGAAITIAVRSIDDVGRYGSLDVCSGRVIGFFEKGRSGPGIINAGVYLMDHDVFERFGPLPERFSLENDFLMAQLGSLRPLAFEVDGEFIDIGLPEDYLRAQSMFACRG